MHGRQGWILSNLASTLKVPPFNESYESAFKVWLGFLQIHQLSGQIRQGSCLWEASVPMRIYMFGEGWSCPTEDEGACEQRLSDKNEKHYLRKRIPKIGMDPCKIPKPEHVHYFQQQKGQQSQICLIYQWQDEMMSEKGWGPAKTWGLTLSELGSQGQEGRWRLVRGLIWFVMDFQRITVSAVWNMFHAGRVQGRRPVEGKVSTVLWFTICFFIFSFLVIQISALLEIQNYTPYLTLTTACWVHSRKRNMGKLCLFSERSLTSLSLMLTEKTQSVWWSAFLIFTRDIKIASQFKQHHAKFCNYILGLAICKESHIL